MQSENKAIKQEHEAFLQRREEESLVLSADQ